MGEPWGTIIFALLFIAPVIIVLAIVVNSKLSETKTDKKQTGGVKMANNTGFEQKSAKDLAKSLRSTANAIIAVFAIAVAVVVINCCVDLSNYKPYHNMAYPWASLIGIFAYPIGFFLTLGFFKSIIDCFAKHIINVEEIKIHIETTSKADIEEKPTE